MPPARRRQRIGHDAMLVHRHAHERDAAECRRRAKSRIGEGFGEHHVARFRQSAQQRGKRRLRSPADDEAIGFEVGKARPHPCRCNRTFIVAAAGRTVGEVARKPDFARQRGNSPRHPPFDVRLGGLRRQVHGQIDFRARERRQASLAGTLGDERSLSHPRLRQPAAPRFGIGARHGGEIDVERFRESAMGRKNLASPQAATANVRCESLDDPQIDRAGAVLDCRGPIHTISVH